MSEAALQNAVRLEAARRGIYLWRNNNGALPDSRGVPIRFGLGNDSAKINEVLKSSDLIGIMPVIIQPYHIGMRLGVFMSSELKEPNWRGPRNKHERAQENWINLINQNGGRGGFVSSMDDFFKLLTF